MGKDKKSTSILNYEFSNSYSIKDQVRFSKLSGDFNPIHLDDNYARRSLWGGIAVYGVYQLLSAVEFITLKKDKKIKLVDLQAEFIKPLALDTLTQVLIRESDKNINISINSLDGIPYTKISFTFEVIPKSEEFRKTIKEGQYDDSLPIEHDISELDNLKESFKPQLNYQLLKELFPNLYERVPYSQITTILCSSKIVGMKCPGKNSIFNRINLSFKSSYQITSQKINYEVKKVHSFFKLVEINFFGDDFSGLIRSFIRPVAQLQSSIETLSSLVSKNQFFGEKALVIGGSRGIGETTSKLLALGGADVTLTYNNGKKEAKTVVKKLRSFGCNVKCIKFDVLDSDIEFKENYSSLYYFASPKIFLGNKDFFSEDIFVNFSKYYLTSFVRIVQVLHKNGLNSVFYPSSTAIDELNNGMWEYSSAKVAGEHICDLLEKRYLNLSIYKPQFPRTATDQTLTVMPSKSFMPEEFLVKFLNNFNKVKAKG
jgi:hypothetical protein